MFNFCKWIYLRPGIYKKEKNEDIENKVKILDDNCKWLIDGENKLLKENLDIYYHNIDIIYNNKWKHLQEN